MLWEGAPRRRSRSRRAAGRLAGRRGAGAGARRAARRARQRRAAAARCGLRLCHRPRRSRSGRRGCATAARRRSCRCATTGRSACASSRTGPTGWATQRASFDTRAWRVPRAPSRAAVGPHLVRVGWFPQVRDGDVRVVPRRRARPAHARRDRCARRRRRGTTTRVAAGRVARYAVVRPRRSRRRRVHANVPRRAPRQRLDALRGKSAWLAFSGDPLDDASYAKLDVDRIVATAARAGLRSIELRLAYGAFDEVTPAAKATIDQLIDGLAAHHVAVIGWTVPRTAAFDDLARNVAVAAYRTPGGNAIARPGGRPRARRGVPGRRSGRLRRAERVPGGAAARGRAARAAGRDGRGPVPRASRRRRRFRTARSRATPTCCSR